MREIKSEFKLGTKITPTKSNNFIYIVTRIVMTEADHNFGAKDCFTHSFTHSHPLSLSQTHTHTLIWSPIHFASRHGHPILIHISEGQKCCDNKINDPNAVVLL